MSVTKVDNNLNHLYPPFRKKLLLVLEDVARLTGEPWRMVEGYRSQGRQTWLYAQGRTRPGPIVTWKRSPTWHGTGLAADVAPIGSGYNAPRSHWEKLRACYHRHGLTNPAWAKGDLGHVQLSDSATRVKALEWIRRGFPPLEDDAPEPAATSPVKVFVDGVLVRDAAAYLEEGRVYAWVRAVVEALHWGIEDVDPDRVTLVREDDDAEQSRELVVRMRVKGGKGFVAVRDLVPLGLECAWDGKADTLRLRAT